MKFTLSAPELADVSAGALLLAVPHQGPWPDEVAQVDALTSGAITRLRDAGELPRKAGEVLTLHAPAGLKTARLLLCGTGEAEKLDRLGYHRLCQGAGKALRASRATDAVCLLPLLEVAGTNAAWRLRQCILGLEYADYVYQATKKPAEHAAPATETVSLPAQCGDASDLAQAQAIAAGQRRCRELGDLPPNIVNPVYLGELAEKLAAEVDGLESEVYDEDQLMAEGLTALLAVGRGSRNPSRLVVLKWMGADRDQAPFVLVGKGVTFDTGGISIKPRDNMEQMKYDMCGAATAIGVIEACARMRLECNVIAVVPAVENMPDGDAYRPGDVVTTMSGQTVEVLNTDAEGRMILCDALTWSERYNSAATVDIATLTGACVVALGHAATAVMSPDDTLAQELLAAGEASADRAWRLPLWDEYQQQLDTPFADMKNIGGLPAGTITAGCFLSRFATNQRWAHLDIAGSAWKWGKTEGATGRPVPLLCQWLIDQHGKDAN